MESIDSKRDKHSNLVRLLKLEDVLRQTNLSKPTIYRLMNTGQFPRPLKLSPNRVAWKSADVDDWINSRPISEGF